MLYAIARVGMKWLIMDKLATHMRLFMRISFYICLFVFCLDVIIHFNHYPGGNVISWLESIFFSFFWLLAILELATSNSVARKDKYFWMLMLSIAFIIQLVIPIAPLYLLLQSGYLKWSKPFFFHSNEKTVYDAKH